MRTHRVQNEQELCKQATPLFYYGIHLVCPTELILKKKEINQNNTQKPNSL